ncbi:nitrate reductase molybdenum cofactor assembly chaperone [Granulicoccus sp. GXG6511]|uniref:nitrate reductase molybdenum cofactor assembly chaperone n=1 Tax=Granulicoccus sp. GXG6511 TaxID=3381351 RepID=UPI003D7ED9DE
MRWPGRKRSGAAEGARRRPDEQATSVYAAAALVLAYPDQALVDRLDAIAETAARAGVGEEFAPLLAHLRGELTEIQAQHAQEFDYSRRHALNLTYWIDGDTRRRGESLLRYKQAYRDSGLFVDLGGELPDYLPMVLEFAVHDPERGRELLSASRPALELLRFALRDDELPHAGVIAAICATLPGDSPTDRLSVTRMQGWQPPTETVGVGGPVDIALAPYSMTSSGSAPSVPHGVRLPILNSQEL